MRQTSIDVYTEIKASGLLSKRRWQVYDCLFHEGPLTGNELVERLKLPGAWKRLSELEAETVVRDVGERQCSVTGREVTLWDVTSNLPIGTAHSTATGPPRPSADHLGVVIDLLRHKWVEADSLGQRLPDDHPYVTVGKWLAHQKTKAKQ